MAVEWLTQMELASRLGVAASSITAAIKAGRIDGRPKGARLVMMWPRTAKIFAQTSPTPEELLKRIKAWKPGNNGGGGGNGRARAAAPQKPTASQRLASGKTLADVKKRREHWQALKLKLEYERESGALLPAAELAGALASIGARTRKALTSIPARTAAILAAETDPHAVKLYLEQEIKGALEGLARDLRNMAEKKGG